MPIKRCSGQNTITLEAFYKELLDINNSAYPMIGKRMLALLEMVNELFQETILWAHTSHERLVLHNKDSIAANDFVIISNVSLDEYYFDYLLPKHKSPWDYARVQGTAASLAEAKKYLLIAMRECEGWVGNEELTKLLKAHL